MKICDLASAGEAFIIVFYKLNNICVDINFEPIDKILSQFSN